MRSLELGATLRQKQKLRQVPDVPVLLICPLVLTWCFDLPAGDAESGMGLIFFKYLNTEVFQCGAGLSSLAPWSFFGTHGHGRSQVQASTHDLEGWLISILAHDAGKMTTKKVALFMAERFGLIMPLSYHSIDDVQHPPNKNHHLKKIYILYIYIYIYVHTYKE